MDWLAANAMTGLAAEHITNKTFIQVPLLFVVMAVAVVVVVVVVIVVIVVVVVVIVVVVVVVVVVVTCFGLYLTCQCGQHQLGM